MDDEIKTYTVIIAVIIAIFSIIFGVCYIIMYETVTVENEYLKKDNNRLIKQNNNLRELYYTQVKDYKGEYEYYE